MKQSLAGVLFAVVFPVAVVVSIPTASGSTGGVNKEIQCGVNCTEIVETSAGYMLVGVDQHGDILFEERLNISAENRGTHIGEAITHNSEPSPSGAYVRYDHEIYTTVSEIVAFTTYRYYDAQGDLVDVKTDEARYAFPKGEHERYEH